MRCPTSLIAAAVEMLATAPYCSFSRLCIYICNCSFVFTIGDDDRISPADGVCARCRDKAGIHLAIAEYIENNFREQLRYYYPT